MKSFALYYLEKQLSEISESSVIIESSDLNLDDLYQKGVLGKRKKALNSLLNHLKEKYVKFFYNKFPKIQYEDIQEAFEDTTKKIIEEKPKSKSKIENLFKKTMLQFLSNLSKKKNKIRKNLSCVKVVKSSGKSIGELMRRAEKILTHREKEIIEMCSNGKSVREISKQLNISHPTVWRSLNSGLDKLRVSYGMKSRKLG